MVPLFGNGIKIIFLLLLANAASRRPNRHQKHYVDPDQTERHQSDQNRQVDPSEWHQAQQNRQPDPSERYQAQQNRQPDPPNRYQAQQNRRPDQPERYQAQQNRRPDPPERYQAQQNRKPDPSELYQSQQNRVSDQNKLEIYQSNGGELQKVSDRNPRSQGHGNHETFLSRLLNVKNGPVVVFLTPGSDLDLNHRSLVRPEPKVISLDDEYANYSPTKAENDAYVLYSIIKTTQEEEDLDPEANRIFDQTKQILRTYFRAQCGAKQSCEQKCPPPPKETGCQMNCQQIFDKLDACPPPPKKDNCNQKRGKTLPPDWPKQEKDIYC